MLYAKISPKATFVKETGPFTSPVYVEAEYLIALARPYIPGASQTDFEVIFGDVIIESEIFKQFNPISSIPLSLTSSELSDWGTDDTTLLNVVASKLETSCVDFVNIEG